MEGGPIDLEFRPRLSAYRGKLLSGQAGRGRPVHAASFIRQRRIVIEEELLRKPLELRLILNHELFHFVWWKLGNRRRKEYSDLLAVERLNGARGELGESAAVAKEALLEGDPVGNSTRWRNYICESFCDTGAWLYSGVSRHEYFLLSKRWRDRRTPWFANLAILRV